MVFVFEEVTFFTLDLAGSEVLLHPPIKILDKIISKTAEAEIIFFIVYLHK
jgi:hypothetical protein